MASEAELESLVVALKADVENFRANMDDAIDKTRETAQDVERSANKIESFAGSVEEFGAAMADALGSLGIGAFLENAFEQFSEGEDVLIKMKSTLRAQGRDVEALTADYEEFAVSIQNITTLGDEAVKTLLSQAESFGLTGDAAKEAVKDAIGLAASTGSSAEAMLRLTTAMAEGDVKRAMLFSRMVPQLRGVKNELEFVAKFQKLVNAGIETSQELASTASGRLKQLEESYGDLLEQIGETVAMGLLPFAEGMRGIVIQAQNTEPWIKQTFVTVAALTAGVLALSAAGKGAVLIWGSQVAAIRTYIMTMTAAKAATAAMTSAVALAGAALVYVIYKSIEASAKHKELIAELSKVNTDRFMDDARETVKGVSREQQLISLKEKHGEAVKRVAQEEANLIAAREAALEHGPVEWFQREVLGVDALGGKLRETKDQVKALERLMAEIKAKQKLGGASDVQARDNAIKGMQDEVGKLTKAFRDQAQMVNMSTDEVEAYKAALKGIPMEALEPLKAAVREFEKMTASKEAAKGIDEFVKSLEIEIETFGKAADEARLYALEKEGLAAVEGTINEERFKKQVEEARNLIELKKGMEERAAAAKAGFGDEVFNAASSIERAVSMQAAARSGSAEARGRIAAFNESNNDSEKRRSEVRNNLLRDILGEIRDKETFVLEELGL